MAIVALGRFGIRKIALLGPFGPIHLLPASVLSQPGVNIRAARLKHIRTHARSMKLLTLGALVGAGSFTFLPRRIMYRVVTGG